MYILWNIKVLIFVHFYFPFFVHSYIIINSNGIEKLIFGNKYKNKKSFGIKDAKISKFYNEKITIILEEENDRYNQCVLAYRFLKTILKYTNFQVCNKNEELSNTSRKKYFKFTNGMAASIEETLKYILGQV